MTEEYLPQSLLALRRIAQCDKITHNKLQAECANWQAQCANWLLEGAMAIRHEQAAEAGSRPSSQKLQEAADSSIVHTVE